MFPELVQQLCCPICHGLLSINIIQQHGDQIWLGSFECGGCKKQFFIRHGIADFLVSTRPTSFAHATNELWPTAWAYERIWRPSALTLLSGEKLPYTHELALITQWSAIDAGGLFLDLACSNGLYARAFAEKIPVGKGHVVAVDHSLAMLQDAQTRARQANLRISYIRASAQALPFRNEAMATIAIGGSLNEIGDLHRCLAEIQRTLQNTGRLVTMTLTEHPDRFEATVQRLLALGGIRFWPADTLIRLFQLHGLTLQERQQYGIVLFTLAQKQG